MDKKTDNSKDKDDTKKPSGRRNHSIGRNMMKWNKRTRIYVPNSQRIKERILKENYEPADVKRLGQQWIIELIKRNYWWPGIKNDVKKYVQGCFKYQQNKVQHMKKAGELHPLKTPEGPWKEISIDIIGPLPKSNKNDVIVVIVN